MNRISKGIERPARWSSRTARLGWISLVLAGVTASCWIVRAAVMEPAAPSARQAGEASTAADTRVVVASARECTTDGGDAGAGGSAAAGEFNSSDSVEWVHVLDMLGNRRSVRRCQARCLVGVDCGGCQGCGEPSWRDRRPIPWEVLAQGEYVGPFRDVHVPEYRLRVDDELEFVYRLDRVESAQPYELNVGDQIRVESIVDDNLNRELLIQPDGMITLRMLGQVRAARRTVAELQADLEQRYTKFYKVPAITVTPIQVNTKLEDLRSAVDSRYGVTGGQAQQSRVTPEGTIQLPGIAPVPAQGLTLDELKQEVDERYAQLVGGLEVTPRLSRRAPRYIYVVGEVPEGGRFALEAPTTAMQAIAMAGGWTNGGNLRQIVVFRRTDDWQLIATRLDLRGALLGESPCPADEIFLRDSDVVVVPKSQLLRTTDLINLLFTRGIYGVFPMSAAINFQKLSTI